MRLRTFMLLLAVLAVSGGAVYLYSSGIYRPYLHMARELVRGKKYNKKPGTVRSLIENNIVRRIQELEIPDSSVTFRKDPRDSSIVIRVVVPQGKPAEWVVWHFSSAVTGTAYRVDDCSCPDNGHECVISFTGESRRQPNVTVRLRWSSRYYSKSAQLAIVITDFGFEADRTTIEYLSFAEPLTVSLAPSRKLSSWTAQISNEYKKEVVILLPMEVASPLPAAYRASCVMIHYPEAKVRLIVNAAAVSVPNFSGITNLGGTRVLQDSRVSDILFSECKKRRCYFLETPVSEKTVVAQFARKYGVPTATINGTVAPTLTVQEIQDLLRTSAAEALNRGSYILSSKATDAFMTALKKTLPELHKNGIRLARVSDIVTETNGSGR